METRATEKAFDYLKKCNDNSTRISTLPTWKENPRSVLESPVGLGGGLFQKTSHGYQPVHYVSRTLTETERKYAQIEREALAVEFSTNRLQMYLLGSQEFQIAADHKPLIPIFNNPNAKLPPRLERLRMKTAFRFRYDTQRANQT